MSVKIRFIITALFIIAAALAGCAAPGTTTIYPTPTPAESPVATPTATPQPGKGLEITQLFWGKSEGSQVIAGRVRNAGETPLQGLTVELYALDGSSQIIWTVKLDVVPDKTDSALLEPGDEASFASLENVDLPDMKLYQYRFLTASGDVLQAVPGKVRSTPSSG